ncbi:CoaE-domain-containing protein [Lentinula aciculospora]|uniref:CoaE-domain-containing protein n=1 Tax=Lentinula aciculospora TaxID=153920 RepID=A0A9W9DH32_9AGAR|nr:CoaE-domain-containing protein [Lentinula aciculospora]
MLVIGLTGGIATGKSTVSKLLKDRHVLVIDADVIARQVVEPGTSGLAKIVRSFGDNILLPDGSLDRKALGSIIFKDEQKRKQLNAIVHPAVRRAMFWGVFKCWLKGHRFCVLDVPLLIEGPLWKLVYKVVLVYCPADIQLRRLMLRDNSSIEDASSRLNSQIPIRDKLKYADDRIDNSGGVEELNAKVDAFVVGIRKEAGWSWVVSWLIPPYGLASAACILAWRAIRRSYKMKEKDF